MMTKNQKNSQCEILGYQNLDLMNTKYLFQLLIDFQITTITAVAIFTTIVVEWWTSSSSCYNYTTVQMFWIVQFVTSFNSIKWDVFWTTTTCIVTFSTWMAFFPFFPPDILLMLFVILMWDFLMNSSHFLL